MPHPKPRVRELNARFLVLLAAAATFYTVAVASDIALDRQTIVPSTGLIPTGGTDW